MEPEHVQTVMMTASCIWAFGAAANLLRRRKPDLRAAVIPAAVSLLILVATLSLAALVWPGRNSLGYLLRAIRGHELRHLAAKGIGLSLGSALALWTWQSQWARGSGSAAANVTGICGLVAVLAGFALTSIFIADKQIVSYLSHAELTRDDR